MSFNSSRRGFLQVSGLGALATGALHAGAGSLFGSKAGSPFANVGGLKCAPLEEVKVGVIGLGMRGPGAVARLSAIPGVRITALCDLFKNRVENAAKHTKGKVAPKFYFGGEDEWKKVCESPDVNLVYVTSPWQMHVPMVMYAMECGKHVACEVPMVFTIEDSWKIVRKAEEKRVHCMLLENCCYGENEMLALNMVRNGVLGTLVHGEGAYIHDLRGWEFLENSYEGFWRLKWNAMHQGNPYATHGLGPICQYMNVNHGDRMTYLSSMSSGGFGRQEYVDHHPEITAQKSAGEKYGMSDQRAIHGPWKKGDMNTSIIKTEMGRTIMIQHDVTSPRPYSRINLISGTKGILKDYPLEIGLDQNYKAPHMGWLQGDAKKELIAKWKHPLWKESGEIAKQMGGHGGMDFLMDLRLCYCLQNGLPLDINVYDSVLWSVLAELTEISASNNGQSVEVPDFTCGAYKDIAPLGIETVDMKLGNTPKADPSVQLNV